MDKNINYEQNVLIAFVNNYNKYTNNKWILKNRRNPREDGYILDINTNIVYSIELTKVTDYNIEKINSFLINKNGQPCGELYDSFSCKEIIETIQAKVNKRYKDESSKILILDSFSCVPFSWHDKWIPVINYAKNTNFFKIFAIQQNSNIEILEIK